MTTRVHLVSHTHWDREWYFTVTDSHLLSDIVFNEIIEELSKHEKVHFILDGQLSILEDYVALYPEQYQQIKKLVERGQLYIGPWFTQTDCAMVTGEAILRNGQLGNYYAQKYGSKMEIGYLPDTFGFTAQMPVILNELGLKRFVFWRGINFEKHVNRPYFKWQSLGGQHEVTAVNYPYGYSMGMMLEPTKEYVQGRLDVSVKKVLDISDETDVIIPVGNDQLSIITDIEEKVEQIKSIGKYDYVLDTLDGFFDVVENQDLPRYSGELFDPKYARVHKTISSVRSLQKQMIFRLENRLIQQIEPLMVMAERWGIKLSKQHLLKAWGKLCECMAHDSMAGCVVDSVARDIDHRLKEVSEISDGITNVITRRLAEVLNLQEDQVLLLNTSASQRRVVSEMTYLSPFERVTSFEPDVHVSVLASKWIEPRENITEELPEGNRLITEPGYYQHRLLIETEVDCLSYRVVTLREGTSDELKVADIRIEDGLLYVNEVGIEVVDEENAGDTYDFSPAEPACFDRVIWKTVEGHRVTGLLGDTKVELTILSDRIDLVMKNTRPNRRLRMGFVFDEPIQKVNAGTPFGFINRINLDLTNWQEAYSEKPVNQERFIDMLTAYTNNKEVHIASQDTREYGYDNNTLYLTILTSTDSLGKPDLINRPGRASGDTTKKGHIMMDTPDAQALGKDIHFEVFFSRQRDRLTWLEGTKKTSVAYQNQSLNYFLYRLDNKLEPRKLDLNLASFWKPVDGLMVSSVHPAYQRDRGYVVRFENRSDQTVLLPMINGVQVNALEQEVEPVSEMEAYSIVTYWFNDEEV